MSSKSIFRALWFPALTLFLLAAAPRSRAQQTFPSFQVRSYMGRCLDFGAPPQVADPKVALCAAIENNYNNCLRHQHDGCPAWVIELNANHCF